MRSLMGFALACLLIAAAAVAVAVEAKTDKKESTTEAASKSIGQKAPNFSLRDQYGKPHALADYAADKIIVVAFLGNECPLARLYATRLNDLAAEYSPKGVKFLGVNSNRQDALTEIGAFARQLSISFPLLKDAGNVVADALGAERTPQVFVLDAQRVVRYQGRVDDQYGVGFQRPAVTERDLALALDALLSGKPVAKAVTDAPGCLIGRVAKKESRGDVTYHKQISRILNERCVACHRPGEIGPFPLTNYEEASGWAPTVREVVDEGRMPPWFAKEPHGVFSNDARLSDEEKRLISAWVDDGCPEGDKKDAPNPPSFAEGWQIPTPDLIVPIDDVPAKVAAQGVLPYRYFIVDPYFKEEKWIRAIEARPGNRAVVHHIIVGFIRPGEQPRLGLGGGSLVGYAPGMPPQKYPEGSALFVPRGAKIVFQVHYTPNGTPQEDLSCVGLVFAKPSEVREKVSGDEAANTRFRIPAGANNFELHARHVFHEDVRLLSMTPHMHMRGKSFRYEAVYPNGRREVLLDVPRYDFNWQLRYDLAEPKFLPRGSHLHCTAHFDNSEENLNNPNPRRNVGFGEQTWDEMMIGYFTTLPGEPPK
ncbi:MAG TPA: redoxin domain-containing protein [Pirellulales bacterium]|jgi:peroxiredoxin